MLKARINKVTKGNMQVDVEVTYFDDMSKFTEDRVLSLPEEKLAQLDQASLLEFIRAEGKRYVVVIGKKDEFSSLEGQELDI